MSQSQGTPRFSGKRKRITIANQMPTAKRGRFNPASRARRSLMYSSSANNIFRFKRTYLVGIQSTDGINPFLAAFNFSINDVPGYTELTNLFNWYKITGVKFRMHPEQTNSNSTSGVNNAMPTPLVYAIDTANATAPGSVAAVCEFNQHVVRRCVDGIELYFKPGLVDNTGLQIMDEWMTTANAATNYIGVKVGIPATGTALDFYVSWTLYISCKETK